MAIFLKSRIMQTLSVGFLLCYPQRVLKVIVASTFALLSQICKQIGLKYIFKVKLQGYKVK